MEETSRVRARSSPDLSSPSASQIEDYSFKGIATNVKLLLKLIEQHNNEALRKDSNESKSLRVAGMMSILDDVKTQIQKSQSLGKKREAELRQCNTDLKPNIPSDKKPLELINDEKDRLTRELNASSAARKSLEIMCSSMGKEKEIIAKELARKVQEVKGKEELVIDLKAQNDMLLEKLQACAKEHKEKKGNGGDPQGNLALQERNKALSEQLLKSLDGYKSLKRKFRDAQQQNSVLRETMEEMGLQVQAGLSRLRSFKEIIKTENEQKGDIEMEISTLEHTFECFDKEISKHTTRK